MDQDARIIAELNALRYELLGYSEMLPGTPQQACRRYQSLLSKIGGDGGVTERLLLRDIQARIDDICCCLEKTPVRNPREQADRVQKSVTDLRMIVDMHLHMLSTAH
jgi:hypothetical protein